MIACETSNNVNDQFPESRKPISMLKSASKTVIDYKLSRYACYLIVQNTDLIKEAVCKIFRFCEKLFLTIPIGGGDCLRMNDI